MSSLLGKVFGSSTVLRTGYNLVYRHGYAEWDKAVTPHPLLASLLERERIRPSRAIDLGCGTGRTVIYLAKRGFEMTGVDWSSHAIKAARQKARDAGVSVNLSVGNLLDLHVDGPFEVLLDLGSQLALFEKQRYWKNILPLMDSRSTFVLYCHERPLRRWERWVPVPWSFDVGAVERQLGDMFYVERSTEAAGDYVSAPHGEAMYLLKRRP